MFILMLKGHKVNYMHRLVGGMSYIEKCKVAHIHGLTFAYLFGYEGGSNHSCPQGFQHQLLDLFNSI